MKQVFGEMTYEFLIFHQFLSKSIREFINFEIISKIWFAAILLNELHFSFGITVIAHRNLVKIQNLI